MDLAQERTVAGVQVLGYREYEQLGSLVGMIIWVQTIFPIHASLLARCIVLEVSVFTAYLGHLSLWPGDHRTP